MPLYTIPDHVSRALELLDGSPSNNEDVRTLVEIFVARVQELEDLTWSCLIDRQLINAAGVMLDQYGDLAGEPRGGLGDRDYRRFIQARMIANRCDGEVELLMQLYKVVTGADVVSYWDHFPAGFKLHAYRRTFLDDAIAARVVSIMTDAKPAGVGMVLTESVNPPFLRDGVTPTYDGPLHARTLRDG